MTADAPNTIPPAFDNIPGDLTCLDHWVLWRWQQRNDKWTKPPFTPHGRYAKTNDPSTWSTFQTVRAAYEHGGFSGVGLCLAERDSLTGIDLDHCIHPVSQQITKPEAEEILRMFALTYCELSPSGTGLRIWVFGKAQRSGKAPKLEWIEVYSYPSSRFLTVTGVPYQMDSAAN